MLNILSKSYRFACIVVIICVCSIQVFAQERSLRVIGTVESNMKPLPGTKINLLKDGGSVDVLFTKADGEFLFDLEINHEYLIEVQKEGFLTKRIAFNTELPDDVFGKWTMEFAMSLFESCEGVNSTALIDPVDRIKYSANKSDFISDDAYVQKMRDRIGGLLMDIEKCHSDKFQDLVQEADALNKENKMEEARQMYEEALKIFPDDKSAQRKVDVINDKIGVNQENQQNYNTALSEADKLYAEKQYEAAKVKYTEALQAMPQNNYPREKVAQIDRMIQEKNQAEQSQLNAERDYNNLVAQGNAAYTSKNFVAAKSYYEQALLVKPGASFAQQRIAELGPAIEKQKQENLKNEAGDKAYKEALAMGQSALQAKNFEIAKQHFNKAVTLKPEESYPKNMIKEIDQMIADQQAAQMQANKQNTQAKINEALDEGDAMYKAKNYDAAAGAYQRALQLDPKDSYAQERLNKSKSMMAAADVEKQKNLEKAQQDKIIEADALVAAASYQQAIAVYQQALLAKPNDVTIQEKLSNAQQKLAEQQNRQAASAARKKEYDQLLTQGNNYFATNQYANAKASFTKAMTLFPDQPYPRSKVEEIDAILARNQKELEYKDIISRADNVMASKDYIQAKSLYQQALAVKAGDFYAQQKISETDLKISENQRLIAEQKAKEAQYTATIKEADNLFALARFSEARAAYQRALALKAAETYPKSQIATIDARISEQARLENEKKAKEQQYNGLISKGSSLFAAKNYSEAKTAYQQALALNSTEGLPRQKIAEIDAILSQQQQQAAEQKALDQRYSQVILQADNLFEAKKYTESKNAYEQALGIKPTESYPKSQIAKIGAQIAIINQMEAAEKAKELRYKEAITLADQLYGQNSLEDAKTQYEKALSVKPEEAYPRGQIVKINGQLAQIEKTKQEKAAFEQQYNSIIASADKAYDNRDYKTAKSGYMQALSMKSSETYPQQRLNKIAELERIIAQKEAAQKAAIASATASSASTGTATTKSSKLAELYFANDSEREKYLNELKKNYPQGVSLEVFEEKNKTTERYVVYRGDEIREFRKIIYSWGIEYSMNGIPITDQYFKTQVQVREGEFFKETKL